MLTVRTRAFLAELDVNNDRGWFAAHKADYEADLKRPAEAFAEVLSDEMAALTGLPHRYKIFRIHRDVRFAKDKRPYNAHLHISVFPGGGCQEGGPVWMFGLDPQRLVLGAGIFEFSAPGLEHWRAQVGDYGGDAVAQMLAGLVRSGARIDPPELKRVPAPYPAGHPHGDLLRRKGLTAWIDATDETPALGPDGPAACARQMLRLRPLFDLLADLT